VFLKPNQIFQQVVLPIDEHRVMRTRTLLPCRKTPGGVSSFSPLESDSGQSASEPSARPPLDNGQLARGSFVAVESRKQSSG